MHNVTESLDNTNHMSIDGNRKLGSSNGHQQQTVDYSKKEIPKLNKLKKKNRIQKDDVFQKVENTEITSRNTCDPNWGRDKITMYPDNKKNFLTSNIIETRQRDAATSRIPFKCNGCTITSRINYNVNFVFKMFNIKVVIWIYSRLYYVIEMYSVFY